MPRAGKTSKNKKTAPNKKVGGVSTTKAPKSFEKQKQKAGKAKIEARNATNTTVKATRINMPIQRAVEREVNIGDLFSHLRHTNASIWPWIWVLFCKYFGVMKC